MTGSTCPAASCATAGSARLEQTAPDYAIVSDGSHGFSLVHYYIAPEAQIRQLAEEGFAVLGVADLDGRALAAGDAARRLFGAALLRPAGLRLEAPAETRAQLPARTSPAPR